MTNAQMIPNRFMNLHCARIAFAWIMRQFDANKRVVIATMTKATAYSASHRAMFEIKGDRVCIHHGKRKFPIVESGRPIVSMRSCE